jgi:site-specific DNA-methyltransferase (adenine-specific)
MINNGLYTSNSEEWETPIEFFRDLDDEFNFTLDVCATADNAKCSKFFTKAQDGLKQDWTGETVWCNPPYGRKIGAWCRKCYEHSTEGGVAVMLVHARTDTAWFHDWILGKAEIRFIRGRLRFGGSKWNAPFPSLVAIFKP